MAFDIDERAAAVANEDDGTVVEILDRSGEDVILDDAGQPVTITATGMNSQKYKAADAWQRMALRRFGTRGPTGKEQQDLQSEFVARCCLGWSGFTQKGQPLPFTTENATAVFIKLPYVQRQVEQAMGDARRFLPTTATP